MLTIRIDDKESNYPLVALHPLDRFLYVTLKAKHRNIIVINGKKHLQLCYDAVSHVVSDRSQSCSSAILFTV